jgi:hypothetical protein
LSIFFVVRAWHLRKILGTPKAITPGHDLQENRW